MWHKIFQRSNSSALSTLVFAVLSIFGGLPGCGTFSGQNPASSIVADLAMPAKVINDLAIKSTPSQRRDWRPELAVLPYVQRDGDSLRVHNVRQCRWRSETDYDVKHSDWQFNISEVRSVDFVVVPFSTAPMLAHTMLSFELSDGRYLALSVEARLESHESYSAVAGAARKYDLIYVLADEQDILGLRGEVRRDDIYLFRTIASPAAAQSLLSSVLERANSLRENPEFYDSLRNSCATNVADHIQTLLPADIRRDWRLLLPGHSDKLAYDLKLIDTSEPFDDVKNRAFVSLRVRQHLGAKDFSRKIRTQPSDFTKTSINKGLEK